VIEKTFMVAVSERFFGKGRSLDIPVRTEKRQWLKRASLVICVGFVVAGLPGLRSKSNSVDAPLLSLQAPPSSVQVPEVHEAVPVVPTLETAEPVKDLSLNVEQPPGPHPVEPPPQPPAPRPVEALRDKPVILAPNGTIAVSSTTSTDIYIDDLYVGSTPISLQMSAGTHTLEYRHEALRKKVTYVINSNETTKATITFDTTVQINAKPWADVFLDGVERQSLGQTPLSNVQVPIGAVLSFENPGFQPKKYRVTGNETGIQIVFP